MYRTTILMKIIGRLFATFYYPINGSKKSPDYFFTNKKYFYRNKQKLLDGIMVRLSINTFFPKSILGFQIWTFIFVRFSKIKILLTF
jgi:hypothetical protein